MIARLSTSQIDAMIPRPALVEPDWLHEVPPEAAGRPRTPAAVHPVPSGGAMSWADIMAEPDAPPPTIRPGLPKVGVVVMAGAPKVGKTLLMSQWALESGLPSLLVIEEGSLSGIAYRLRRQATALGLVDPPLHLLYRRRTRLDNRASVEALKAQVDRIRPAIVTLDPLNRLHAADENRPTQMTPVMDALAEIAYRYECCVVAVHHLAKPSAERRGDVWDRFRGAGSIRSGTDANLALDGTGDHVKLYGEFRDAEPLLEHLELDRESLIFRPAAGGKDGKVAQAELLAFVDERQRVTARDVMERFGVVKVTALAALDATVDLDSTSGPRGQLIYFRTVQ